MLFYEKVVPIADTTAVPSQIQDSATEKMPPQSHNTPMLSAVTSSTVADGTPLTAESINPADGIDSTSPSILPSTNEPQSRVSKPASNDTENDTTPQTGEPTDTSTGEIASRSILLLDESNSPGISGQEDKGLDDTATENEDSSRFSSTQQQQQPPIVMRTAGITERHDNGDGLDPTGLRMVAAT